MEGRGAARQGIGGRRARWDGSRGGLAEGGDGTKVFGREMTVVRSVVRVGFLGSVRARVESEGVCDPVKECWGLVMRVRARVADERRGRTVERRVGRGEVPPLVVVEIDIDLLGSFESSFTVRLYFPDIIHVQLLPLLLPRRLTILARSCLPSSRSLEQGRPTSFPSLANPLQPMQRDRKRLHLDRRSGGPSEAELEPEDREKDGGQESVGVDLGNLYEALVGEKRRRRGGRDLDEDVVGNG